MNQNKKVLRSFLTDAQLLCSEAQESIAQLSEQARLKKVSPAQVRSLYHVVHTIKGTATMIEGGDSIVHALHALEARLSSRSFLECAGTPDWIDLARSSISQTQSVIGLLQRKEKFSTDTVVTQIGSQKSQGLFTEFLVDGQKTFQWFSLSSVIKIWPHTDFAGKDAMSLKGKWLPILGERTGARFGIGVETPSGQVVVTVCDVLAINDLSEAKRQGASDGLAAVLHLINHGTETPIAA